MIEMAPLTLTYQQAGQRLGGFSASTVRRLVKAGHLLAVKIGSSPRIPQSELERYVAELITQAGAAMDGRAVPSPSRCSFLAKLEEV